MVLTGWSARRTHFFEVPFIRILRRRWLGPGPHHIRLLLQAGVVVDGYAAI